MKRYRTSRIILIALLTAIVVASMPHLGAVSSVLPMVAQVEDFHTVQAGQLSQQGFEQYYSGQFETAIESWQQVSELMRELSDRQGEAEALMQLGRCHHALRNYNRAIEFYQQALHLAQELSNRYGESAVLGNIGLVYYDLGNYSEAIQHYEQSLTIAQEIGANQEAAYALGNLGNVYENLGYYSKALELHQQNLALMQALHNRQGEGQALGNLGNVYEALGMYAQAIDLYEKRLTIAEELGDRGGEGIALGYLAAVHANQSDYGEAINYYQQSLAIARARNDREEEARLLSDLGTVYHAQGEVDRALDYYEQSLAIARELKKPQIEVAALSNLGNAYLNLGEPVRAIDYQRQSLQIAQTLGIRRIERTALNNLGFALFKAQRFAEAEEVLYQAIAVGESLRPGLSDTHQVSIFDTQALTYSLFQEVLIAQNKPETALEIAERGRAQAFIELLAQRLSANSNEQATLEPFTIEQMRQVAQEQNATLVEYSLISQEGVFQGTQRGFTKELFIWVIQPTGEITLRSVNLEAEPLAFENLIAANHPASGSIGAIATRGRNSDQSIRVGDFVRLLDENRHPLTQPAYEVRVVDAERGTLFLHNPELTPIEPLQVSIAEIYKVQSPSPHDFARQDLYRFLIEPIADRLPADPNTHIIFIPQQELFLVPFPALQDADGNYLVEKHTMLTAPAIRVLRSTHQHRQSLSNPNHKALVIGNPSPMPENFSPLPNAEIEAHTIADLLNTTPLLGRDATEPAVRQLLSTAPLIHLATHGEFDSEVPLQGAIALAPVGIEYDGLLTAEEILEYQLNAELVVLSACNTGRGRITGDGVIGLSRSWLAAGASSVIVSLWQVPDDATSDLMTEFYRNWQQTPDKALALRQAMLATLKIHDYHKPISWAAFTLIGEAD